MNTYQQREDEEIEIDLREVFAVIISKLWLIIMIGVIFALAAIIGTKLFITPQYKSVTKMYVLSRQDNDTLTSSDLQMSAQLTVDYEEVIQSRTVAESVIAALNLDMTPEELIKKIAVSSADSSRVLSITVTDPDPYVARDIADTVRDTSADQIKTVMNIEAVNVVDMANIPDSPSSPSIKKNGAVAGLFGCFLAIAVILILHITNDTIKTAEDVERYLGISTLGTIPLDKNSVDSKPQKEKKSKRSKKS